MNNHDFNIINQLVQEQKSLWRIENHYISEARNEDERTHWETIREHKKDTISKLSEMAKKCL
ncbi:hypothetical protein CL684_01305 [Candidatus Campbellbacteria bacterium]|nr:hypothetical protein [Candidatus Campbellbacteria bacterium]|tara:strand:+ start:160 stop:345 length:186 start_codon:yes stop_codon:yes gene_type:complete